MGKACLLKGCQKVLYEDCHDGFADVVRTMGMSERRNEAAASSQPSSRERDG